MTPTADVPRGTLILASASPRRRDLLQRLGEPFEVIAPEVSEEVDERLPAEQIAETLAERKARAVAAGRTAGIVLGADTLVSAEGELIGKPRDHADAVRILRKLSRCRHRVITGLCLIDAAQERMLRGHETTWVRMRRMSEAEIEAYVASGEAAGKAGAYAVQETGDRYVESMEGDYDNVVGLPVARVARMLAALRAGEGRAMR